MRRAPLPCWKRPGKAGKITSTPQLAVQSYAPTLLPAAELNEQVKTAMFGAAQLPGVAAVHLNSDYNFTDTSSKTYRYQAVFDVTYYD